MSRNTTLPAPALLILTISLSLPQTGFADNDNKTYCQLESSASGWYVLNDQCDIGNGLWGRKPEPVSSSFWIQCNYGKYLPNRELASKIKSLFPGNHYIVPDNNKYRCLIGPFQDFNQADNAKAQLAAHGLNKAFIRQTASPVAISNKANVETSTPNPAAKLPTSQVDDRIVLNSIIYSFTFNNLKYHQPRNINSTQEMPPAFIQEHNQYWSKVNYLPAANWCKRYGLRLPTVNELKDLQTNGQYLLLRHQWPVKSSYWSETLNPYTGEIKTLNLRSGHFDEYRPLAQLYTTCVTEAS